VQIGVSQETQIERPTSSRWRAQLVQRFWDLASVEVSVRVGGARPVVASEDPAIALSSETSSSNLSSTGLAGVGGEGVGREYPARSGADTGRGVDVGSGEV